MGWEPAVGFSDIYPYEADARSGSFLSAKPQKAYTSDDYRMASLATQARVLHGFGLDKRTGGPAVLRFDSTTGVATLLEGLTGFLGLMKPSNEQITGAASAP